MTKTTTHKTFEALLRDVEALLIETEAKEEEAAADYDRRLRESTEEILNRAGIDVRGLRWQDGTFIWGDYTIADDGENDLIITYTHPKLSGITEEMYVLNGESAEQIGKTMLELKHRAEEKAERPAKVTLYEAEQYAFTDRADWELYAQRFDDGWKVHARDFLLAGGIAFLVVVWTKEVEV